MSITIILGKVWYNKKDYKILNQPKGFAHPSMSPAGTLKDWKEWAKDNGYKIKISKKVWR